MNDWLNHPHDLQLRILKLCLQITQLITAV